mgnify:CR=1 FL=1
MGIYFNPSMIASEKTEIIRYMLIKQSCLITQMNGWYTKKLHCCQSCPQVWQITRGRYDRCILQSGVRFY